MGCGEGAERRERIRPDFVSLSCECLDWDRAVVFRKCSIRHRVHGDISLARGAIIYVDTHAPPLCFACGVNVFFFKV